MYKLKPNAPDFEVVDGQLAGRKYKAGQVYTEIPAKERHKFIPEFDPTLTIHGEGNPTQTIPVNGEGNISSPVYGGIMGGKGKEGNQ